MVFIFRDNLQVLSPPWNTLFQQEQGHVVGNKKKRARWLRNKPSGSHRFFTFTLLLVLPYSS